MGCETASRNGKSCILLRIILLRQEKWIANYPRDSGPHGDLGVNYASMGQYEKALAETQEALRLEPDTASKRGS